MKEHPLLFNAPMIRALLDDANPKTQTRRPMKPQPVGAVLITHTATVKASGRKTFTLRGEDGAPVFGLPQGKHAVTADVVAPWAIGDRLWVKETWRVRQSTALDKRKPILIPTTERVYYAADESERPPHAGRTRVSIHMPRWASRITLEVTEVRAERLRSISEADAVAEGVHRGSGSLWQGGPHRVKEKGCKVFNLANEAFVDRFHAIYPGDDDPWVWATTFKRVLP